MRTRHPILAILAIPAALSPALLLMIDAATRWRLAESHPLSALMLVSTIGIIAGLAAHASVAAPHGATLAAASVAVVVLLVPGASPLAFMIAAMFGFAALMLHRPSRRAANDNPVLERGHRIHLLPDDRGCGSTAGNRTRESTGAFDVQQQQ